MKRSLLYGVLGFILVAAQSEIALAYDHEGGVSSDPTLTIMRPDTETLRRWIADYQLAPKAPLEEALKMTKSVTQSYDLLAHISYVPSEWDQGTCGNCWAWAGTGALAVALDVEESVSDSLSVQYLNSCGSTGADYACCGGWLSDLANFYTGTGMAVPWSNANASWQDYYQECSDGSSSVSCGSIGVTPSYAITEIADEVVDTQGVGQTEAIANLKNVLQQNKAVYFGFFLGTGSDWDNFFDFWLNEPETSIWSPDDSCGHRWDSAAGGGHAGLIVGYNEEDSDPENHYWVVLNSWGTTAGRPNGLFRLAMNMDYDCYFYDRPYYYYSMYFQTLDVTFAMSCTDNDLDGYGYPAGTGCTYTGEDCDDGNKNVNPGVAEICTNTIDDDCDGMSDAADADCAYSEAANAEASVYGPNSVTGSGAFNELAVIVSPICVVILLRVMRRRIR